jgi:hypothetical protein
LQTLNGSGASATITGEAMKTVLETTLLALILCVMGIPVVAQPATVGPG